MSKGTLYLCATPIGNLGDITYRTVEILNSVDMIACEDTRHTLKLLNHLEINKKLISYHEHNKVSSGQAIIKDLAEGKNIALVTDAGTPAISDPGEDLVKLCIENDIEVISIPGAVAAINALIISGLSTRHFGFEGFLPVSKSERSRRLEKIKNEDRTLIFYEAPHRLGRTIKDLYEAFGNRRISIIKELTKIHETVIRTDLQTASEMFEEQPKGEFVLVVEGFDEEGKKESDRIVAVSVPLKEHVDNLISEGLSKKDAIRRAAEERGIPKREAYNEYERTDNQ